MPLVVFELDAGGATGLNKQVREDQDRLLVRPIPLQLARDPKPVRGARPQPVHHAITAARNPLWALSWSPSA